MSRDKEPAWEFLRLLPSSPWVRFVLDNRYLFSGSSEWTPPAAMITAKLNECAFLRKSRWIPKQSRSLTFCRRSLRVKAPTSLVPTCGSRCSLPFSPLCIKHAEHSPFSQHHLACVHVNMSLGALTLTFLLSLLFRNCESPTPSPLSSSPSPPLTSVVRSGGASSRN